MSNQDSVQKERELIAKVQKNNDMFAMKACTAVRFAPVYAEHNYKQS